MKKQEKKLGVFLCSALAALVCFLIVPQIFPGEDLSLQREKPMILSAGWSVVLPGCSPQKITLPTTITSAKKDEEITLIGRFPELIEPSASLCIRSSLESVRVCVGGTMLYESGTNPDAYRSSPIPSRWNIIPLPASLAGQEITIVFTSPYDKSAGTINEILYGRESTLLFHIIKCYGTNLLMAVVVLLVGVGLMILGMLLRKRQSSDDELLYLGLFAIFVSFWLLGESKLLQLFSGNSFLNANLHLISLLLFPMPFLLYIEHAYTPHGRKWTSGLFWAFAANFVVCMILQLTGIVDMFVTVPMVHVLIAISMLVIGSSLLYETVHWHSKTAFKLLVMQSVLFVSGVLELLNFYRNKLTIASNALQVGLLFYVLLLALDAIQKFVQLIGKEREARYLHSLAYKDLLTGSKNRTAYYEDSCSLFGSLHKPHGRWLVLLDLNNLKSINDSFGHVVGDEALRYAYRCISQGFEETEHCYRIGGDEFALILSDLTEETFVQRLDQFRLLVERQNALLPYDFAIAIGFGQYDPSRDADFECLTKEVDRRMYENKNKIKTERKLKQ